MKGDAVPSADCGLSSADFRSSIVDFDHQSSIGSLGNPHSRIVDQHSALDSPQPAVVTGRVSDMSPILPIGPGVRTLAKM
jgi:hypothetical protein